MNYFGLHGLPCQKLLEGITLSPEYLANSSNYLSWETFMRFVDNASRQLKPGELEDIGKLGPTASSPQGSRDTGMDVAHRLISGVASVKLVYRMAIQWLGPVLFRVVSFKLEELEQGRLRVTMEIPEDRRGSIAFFQVWLGSMKVSPMAIGQPYEAIVQETITSHKAVFDITLPPSLTFVQRLRRSWRILFTASTAFEELKKQQDEIQHYYLDLAERDVKLRLASQVTQLSNLSALGEMAGGVAHELNNPLTFMLIRVGQINKAVRAGTYSPEELLKDVENLERTIVRMAKIVDGLRIFARDASKDPVRAASITTIVDDVLQLTRERIKASGIELRVPAISEQLTALCRSTEISQALANLLRNAFDALKEKTGERWIEIEVGESAENIFIAITDSGSGISEENRTKIFQPFFTTKEIGQGTGLGLSVARGLVESNGGTLSLDASHASTRFVLTLPKAP